MASPAPYQQVPMRDLQGAREAYEGGDVEASRRVHATKEVAEEQHSQAGDMIRSITFGGMDGLVTMFSVVAGASGGGVSINTILILGFSSLVADALSMGVGDALSEKAHLDYVKRERRRELWETENYKQGEIDEMVDLYVAKGMDRRDAEEIMPILAKNEQFFVDLMLMEELGLQPPSDDDNPWFDGLVTFCAFVLFGVAPLLGYAILATVVPDPDVLFVIAICLTAITLFVLGMLKSKFSTMHWAQSGLETLFFGGFVAVVAYLIGWLVSELVPDTGGLH